MTDETLLEFLTRRERDLAAKIVALRGQLDPLEAELAQIKETRNRLRFALPDLHGRPVLTDPLASIAEDKTAQSSPQQAPHRFAEMTIKELIIQSMIDAFPRGATTAELKAFIRVGFGREIEPGSLRSQLRRLKENEILGQEASDDKWNFRNGKRALYARYDHPTSRRAMKELQDDDDESLLNAAAKLAWKDADDKS
jgi:hypothetical protein